MESQAGAKDFMFTFHQGVILVSCRLYVYTVAVIVFWYVLCMCVCCVCVCVCVCMCWWVWYLQETMKIEAGAKEIVFTSVLSTVIDMRTLHLFIWRIVP